jgi:hypothetical protein
VNRPLGRVPYSSDKSGIFATLEKRMRYETALHLLQRLSLGSAEQARFDEKALHLRGLFEQLGLSP